MESDVVLCGSVRFPYVSRLCFAMRLLCFEPVFCKAR